MAQSPAQYPAQLSVDYPDRQLNRLSSALRILFAIPIAIVFGGTGLFGLVPGGAGLLASASFSVLFFPVLLLIVFRQKYPRWWYDFNLNVSRFGMRVGVYFLLMRDEYPSTDEDQSVHLDITYPDVGEDLNRYLPLVKWFLAIPHYVVLFFLGIGVLVAWIVAWFAILFTGRYPRGLFDYMVGVSRWGLRVQAYAFLLTTDKYPPFSLSE